MPDEISPSPGTQAPDLGGSPLVNLPHATLFKRGLAWDVRAFPALPGEREALGPGRSDRYCDYAVWRRGLMYIGLLAGLIAGGFEVFTLISNISVANELPQGGDVFLLMVLAIFVSRAWLVWALYKGLRRWTDISATGAALRRGWLVALLAPVAVSLVPLVLILSGDAEAGGPARQAQAVRMDLAALVVSIGMFWQAAPCVLSLFPGMMRAGLAVKCVFPGRGFGPGVGIAVAPVSALFLLTILIPVQQLVSSMVFLFGVLLVAAVPLLYVRKALPLLAPQTEPEARAGVHATRLAMRLVMVPALLLMAIALLTKEFLGRELVGFSSDESLFTAWNVLGLLAWFVTMISTYTLVCADGLISTMQRLEQRAARNADVTAWRADGEAVAELASEIGPGFLPRPAAAPTTVGESGDPD